MEEHGIVRYETNSIINCMATMMDEGCAPSVMHLPDGGCVCGFIFTPEEMAHVTPRDLNMFVEGIYRLAEELTGQR